MGAAVPAQACALATVSFKLIGGFGLGSRRHVLHDSTDVSYVVGSQAFDRYNSR